MEPPLGQTIPGLNLAKLSQPPPQAAAGSQASSSAPQPKEKKGRKSKYVTRKEALMMKQAAPLEAPRARPSAASGGVPEPTEAYLMQSFGRPSMLPSPRRILVVLDLNGTLLYRPSKKRPFDFVERPHARRFLAYCLDTFHLAIWSSARPDNVDKMLAQLLHHEQRSRCLLSWSRDQFGLDDNDYRNRVQCYKRLTRVWAHPDALAAGRWDQTNTVLVDDSMEKARSEPYNLLEIPEFSGIRREHADVLPQVHDYLNTLSQQSDISRYIRETPFKLDPSYVLPPPPPPPTS